MKKQQFWPDLVILLGLFFHLLTPAFSSGEANKGQEVIMAFKVERNNSFLSEPGNNPVEILRRLGRSINKEWSPEKSSLTAVSIFAPEKIGSNGFLKPYPIPENDSPEKKSAENLLNGFATELNLLLHECKPASQSIIIKMVCNVKNLETGLANALTASGETLKLQPEQKLRLETQLLPLLKAADNLIGVITVSSNGIFGRIKISSQTGKLGNPKTAHDISIERFINDKALMYFCQTHPIENPEETMQQILSIPQSAAIVQMVASAGLDFKTDLLESAARESILYINLSPDGDGGIPDIRFAAPVPAPEKLRNKLPALKSLCVQSGIYANAIMHEKYEMVKLSYFMFPNYAIYAGLTGNFLVIATSQNNLADEIQHISEITSRSIDPGPASGLKRKWRIRTSDFNDQLQKLLQSPFLMGKGIPPISNLTFFEQLGNIELKTTATPENISIIFDIPIISGK